MKKRIIQLGSIVKDTITGFQGTAVARLIWIQGCNRYCVQPPVDKEGKMQESQYFDEPQLKILKVPKEETNKANSNGGPLDVSAGKHELKR